jgi:CheY-like chemotaxis protein
MSRPSKHILVVEDDEDIRDNLREFLEEEGFSVTLAHDGLDGLGKLADMPPDAVILLDARMPVMDGFAFLEALQRKADGPLRWPRIILVTATPKVQLPAGVAALVSKPINLDALLRAITNQG